MGDCQRYSDTIVRFLKQPKVGICALFVLFCFVFLALWRRNEGVVAAADGVAAVRSGESTSLVPSWKDELGRLVRELSKNHRLDLTRLVAMRERSLGQLQDEVKELKLLIDPTAEEQRVGAILRSEQPVLKNVVVIPSVMHMTWKSKTELPPYGVANVAAWREKNPEMTLILYDDLDIERYVMKHFPEFEKYWSLLKPVQKADVFRYVVMWKDGGVYADIDVNPVKPVREWLISGAGQTILWRSANVILGWEMVTTRKDWKGFYASDMQLCQWTFASSAGHALWRAVLDWLLDFYGRSQHLVIKSVIRSTGPGAFSQAVKQFLLKQHGAQLGQEPLSSKRLMRKNVIVGDVVLFSQSAFAAGSSVVDSDGVVLARHQFAGSWKSEQMQQPQEEEDTLAGQHEREVAKLRAEIESLRRHRRRQQKDNKGKKDEQVSPPPGPPAASTLSVKRAAEVAPVAAQWKKRKPKEREELLQPQSDAEEKAARKKYLMQRLAMKAAVDVGSEELDKIEEAEQKALAAAPAGRKKQLLAPHEAADEKPIKNHGMD